ncbi:MAG: sulfatase-like hydrolase/transferase [Acidimicrobiia bacterium]
MASNFVGIPHAERLVFLILAGFALTILLTSALVWLGVKRTLAVRSVFIGTVVAMTWGRLYPDLPRVLVWTSAFLIVAGAVYLFARLDESRLIPSLVTALAVTLIAGPVLSLWGQLASWGVDETNPTPSLTVDMIERPDIFLIVLDGYPGLITMARDFGEDKSGLIQSLGNRGFEVIVSMWSSYPTTSHSVPSLLEMNYPIETNTSDKATEQSLYDLVSGDNQLVSLLKDSGYQTYMVESGWSGAACGPSFDHCVGSPINDEMMFITLQNTLVASMVTLSHPFTIGSISTMKWLTENIQDLDDDGEPSFVFAHLLAPHPPFSLDDRCNRVVQANRATPFVTPQTKGFFLGQVACVDSFMVQLSEVLGPDTVVVFVSDHGTASRHQLNTPGDLWSRDELIERMNVLTAVRTRKDCTIGGGLVTPNLMRRVLSCYTASPIPELGSRMFKGDLVEVPTAEVEELLASWP